MALFGYRRKKRTHKRKKKNYGLLLQFVYGFLTFTAVVLSLTIVWYVTRMEQLTIDSVLVSGGETVSHGAVQGIVESELSGSYFLLIPKRFSYLYPHDRIVESIGWNPRIHSIVVERIDRNTLSVSFEEYLPFALWCGVDSTENCLFVNEEGYAFAEAPPLQGSALIRFNIVDTDPKIGEYLSEQSTVLERTSFMRVLQNELGLRTKGVTETLDGDVIFHLNGGGDLLTAPGVGVQGTFENLQSVLQSEEYSHLKPGNFQYIDLRFGNKVFVNEELVVEEIEKTATSLETVAAE